MLLMWLRLWQTQKIEYPNWQEGHTRRVRSRLSVDPPTAPDRWPKPLMDDALDNLAIVSLVCHSPHRTLNPNCGHKHKFANYFIPDPLLPLSPQKAPQVVWSSTQTTINFLHKTCRQTSPSPSSCSNVYKPLRQTSFSSTVYNRATNYSPRK